MADKNKGGRPPFKLSDEDMETLRNMCRIQCTQDEACDWFGVTDKTLNKAIKARGESSFSDFFKRHRGQGKVSLRRAQWKAAQDGNSTMLVWLGKQMLGQTDKQSVNLGSDADNPMVTRVEFEFVSAK